MDVVAPGVVSPGEVVVVGTAATVVVVNCVLGDAKDVVVTDTLVVVVSVEEGVAARDSIVVVVTDTPGDGDTPGAGSREGFVLSVLTPDF